MECHEVSAVGGTREALRPPAWLDIFAPEESGNSIAAAGSSLAVEAIA